LKNINKNSRLTRENGRNIHNNDNGLIYNKLKQFFISIYVVCVVYVMNVVSFVKNTPVIGKKKNKNGRYQNNGGLNLNAAT